MALEWYITFSTKQQCKALKRARYLWKKGSEATASLSFPNIHPWACNQSCWQSTCDQTETNFEFFPIRF